MPLVTRQAVELAKTGQWSTSTGPWTCTRAQLADAVRAYQSGHFRSPVLKKGHTDPRFDGEEALGRVSNLRLNQSGDTLLGDLTYGEEMDETLHIRWPSRSIEADLGVETSDGETFAMVMSGLALLGETKPAIQSLAELGPRETWEPAEPVEYVAATAIAASIPLAATWEEDAHPRGGKGSTTGGKFVKKGSGYSKGGKADQAPQVRALQKELVRLGFLDAKSGKNGGIDGLFGPATEAAVKKWQAAAGHLATGRVTPQLLQTLQSAKKTSDPKRFSNDRARVRREGRTARLVKDAATMTDRKRVKAAAEELAEGVDEVDGFHVREITSEAVVFAASDGRVWLAAHDEDDTGTIQIGEMCPAVVHYTELAPTAAGIAAHNMQPVVASWARGWEPHGSPGDTLDIAQMREALGLGADATEDDVLAAARTLREQKTAAEATPQTDPAPVAPAPGTETTTPVVPAEQPAAPAQTPAPVVPAVPADDTVARQLAEQAAAIQRLAAAQGAYEKQIGELSTWKSQRLAAEADDRKSQLMASAIKSGKIAPAEKAKWETDYDASPDVTERILARMAPGTAVPVSSTGYVGDAETDTIQAEANQLFASVMGVPLGEGL